MSALVRRLSGGVDPAGADGRLPGPRRAREYRHFAPDSAVVAAADVDHPLPGGPLAHGAGEVGATLRRHGPTEGRGCWPTDRARFGRAVPHDALGELTAGIPFVKELEADLTHKVHWGALDPAIAKTEALEVEAQSPSEPSQAPLRLRFGGDGKLRMDRRGVLLVQRCAVPDERSLRLTATAPGHWGCFDLTVSAARGRGPAGWRDNERPGHGQTDYGMGAGALSSSSSPLAWAADSIARAIAAVSNDAPKVAIEALNRYKTHLVTNLDKADALRRAMGSDAVTVIVDVFHMNIEERSIAESISAHAPHLSHVHLADTKRQAPGSGRTDFDAAVTALAETDYQGSLTMEFRPVTDETLRFGLAHIDAVLSS